MTDYKSMFEQAVRTLAAIDGALGIGDDGCGDPDQTLSAIADLKARAVGGGGDGRVTREMITAAHGVTLNSGDVVLSARLLGRIYLAMAQAAPPPQTPFDTCPTCEALAQAAETERLRDCAGRVIGAFETLGRTNDAVGLLSARARCESVMLELQHVLTPNAK